MSREDIFSDLWLHHQARLRVVAENTAASAFYRARGWQETDNFAHEQPGFLMINRYKPLHPDDFNTNPIT